MYPQQPTQPQQPSQPYYPQQPYGMPPMQQPPQQRPGNWFTRLNRGAQVGIGCLTLIVICGFCGAIGSLVSNANGSNTANTSTSTSTSATQAPQATHAPTNTPKPKAWVTVKHLTGSANQQTETFHVGGQWRITWKCQKADDFGGNFAVTMYYSDGSYGDLVANTTDNNSGVYNGHGDGDVYLKVDTYSENWTVDIQQYQ